MEKCSMTMISKKARKIGFFAGSFTVMFTLCLAIGSFKWEPFNGTHTTKTLNGPYVTSPYASIQSAMAADASLACPTNKQKPFNLTKVAKNTYVRKGAHELFTPNNLAAISNISFVIGETSIAVIDTGGSYCDGKRFLNAIREISQKPISHVINTHVHPDHMFGNQAFKDLNPIFIGHENLPRAMQDKGHLYLENLNRLVGKKYMQGTNIIEPTQTVKDTMTINLGGRELQLKAYQTAHTDQDLTVYDPAFKILWTGDLLFHEHTPVIDGSILGWKKVMDQLAKIPAKHVVPGHGGPFLDWPAALKPQQAYLDTLIKDLRRIIKEGGTMREAQTQAGISQQKSWVLFGDFNARNASTAFAELEWED